MTSLAYASVICAKSANHSKAFQCRSHSPSSSKDLHNRALIKSRTSFAKIADAAELSLLLGVMALFGVFMPTLSLPSKNFGRREFPPLPLPFPP
jgi:hypothetical protein